MPWKPEYAANRRAKYHSDPQEAERRKAQSRDPEQNREYMRAYYLQNRQKFALTPEDRAVRNARRRERYAADPVFKEKCKALSRSVDPARKRDGRLKATFGITSAEYDSMLEKQGGGCAICGSLASSKRGERLAVDHCHDSGAVRGILCANCNQGLGKFKDDAERLRRAIEYLQRD